MSEQKPFIWQELVTPNQKTSGTPGTAYFIQMPNHAN